MWTHNKSELRVWWFLFFCFELFSQIWSEKNLNQTFWTGELQGPLLVLETAVWVLSTRTTYWKLHQELSAASGDLHQQIKFGLFWFWWKLLGRQISSNTSTHWGYYCYCWINIFYSHYSPKRMLFEVNLNQSSIILLLCYVTQLPNSESITHFSECCFLDWIEHVKCRK